MENSAGGPERDGSGDPDAEGRSEEQLPTQRSPPVLLETLAARVPEPAVLVTDDLEIVDANDRFGELVGLSSSVLAGEPLTWVFPSITTEAIAEHCQADSGTYLTERCEGADAEAWVELAFDHHEWDDQAFYFGIAHDITERHEREQILEQYERIVETIEDGIYILDESFTIQAVNSAVESMTGHSEDELVGSSAMVLADESTIDEAARLAQEIQFGDRTVGTLTTELTTADGETLPIETRFTTYDLDDGRFRQVGVVRDISDRKQFERTLAALHDSTRQLLHTATKAEVADLIVSTVTEVLDLPGGSIFLFDRGENVLQQTAVADRVADGTGLRCPRIAPDSGLLWDVFVEDEQATFGPGDDVLPGGNLEATARNGIVLPLDHHGVFLVCTDAELDPHVRELVDLLAASAQAALARVDREVTLRERETERREQNRELRQLKEVNAIIRRIDRVLVEAETVEAIEQAVCDELAASELFSLAWIGRRDASTLDLRAWAGDSASYLDRIDLSIPERGGPPAVRTVRDATMTVESAIADGLRDEPWRTEALSRNFQCAISVPLQYDDFVYGVLTVYGERSSGFSEMLQSVFTELGESIANAVRDVESRQSEATDAIVELDLALGAPEDLLTQLSETLDTTVRCDGAVPHGEDSTRLFIDVADAGDEDVAATIDELVSVESVSRLSTDGDTQRYELIVVGPTVAQTLNDQAANVTSLQAGVDGIEVTLHLTRDVDVREFVERLQRRYPDTQLVARREKRTPHRTQDGLRALLEDELTERQLEVLQTSYLSGFFEWPRESTGQDVAEMLDVSQPTVNRHLRVGQRKLLELLFDGL